MNNAEPAQQNLHLEKMRREWTSEPTVAAWRKWHAPFAECTRGVTDAILHAAMLTPGHHVLDLASGSGEPALALAEAVGPEGHVTATDLGSEMLATAQHHATQKALHNMTFRQANAESLSFPDAAFDRVTCRFGVMFFPDHVRALRESRRVLNPGGRAVFVAWGSPEQPFFSCTAGILKKYAEIPPPEPGAPHVFRFAAPGTLRAAMEQAGFSAVREEALSITLTWPGSPELFWEHFQEIAAPFRPFIQALAPDSYQRMSAEVLAALQPYCRGGHVTLPASIVLVTGMRA
ncbi:MAG: class I SAM-dependent methyltransferase [Acidobacteria bacterium]|nr:class I SAM-dependent methyltransferase [Acidobacteriota bacterium]MBI3663141.1 class I SAM-dependent methyltransferase [Acidobacteriota bacterium]